MYWCFVGPFTNLRYLLTAKHICCLTLDPDLHLSLQGPLHLELEWDSPTLKAETSFGTTPFLLGKRNFSQKIIHTFGPQVPMKFMKVLDF